MMSRHSLLSHLGLLSLSLFARSISAQTCQAFGVDFQGGGTYFQNVTSPDPFTFVSQFDGCDDDVAFNLLVDPNGDQVQCSDTHLTPANTDQLSTCPTLKNQLISGDWSVLIISDNGEDDPIAVERDFSLIVGTPSTSTFTPTVTATFTSTPVVNVSTTVTDTTTTTLVPVTTTVPSTTIKPTTTVTPKRTTVTSTKTILTLNLVKPTVVVIKSTVTKTASCWVPHRQKTKDPKATITPTLLTAAALQPTGTAAARAMFRRRPDGGIEYDRERFIRERREYLAAQPAHLHKRAPDSATVTVTDQNTSEYITSTTTVTGSTVTASTITSTVQVTSTLTPPVVTVVNGKTTAQQVTITAPTPTRTLTKYTIATNWSTKTFSQTVRITTRTTPAPVKSSCIAAGGILY